MKYKPSKKLRTGMLCQMHGQWLVPARGGKVVGVWKDGQCFLAVDANGTAIRVKHGPCLVVSGECSVLAGKK